MSFIVFLVRILVSAMPCFWADAIWVHDFLKLKNVYSGTSHLTPSSVDDSIGTYHNTLPYHSMSSSPQADVSDGPITNKPAAVRAFWDIFNAKVYRLISDLPSAYSGASDDYSQEQLVIKHISKPFFYGGIASIVLFANFRLMANPSVQKMTRGNFRAAPQKTAPKANPARAEPTTGTGSTPLTPRPKREEYRSTLTMERDKRKEKLEAEIENLSGLPLDFILSTMLGLSITSFLFTGRANMDRNRNAYEITPLLPGKSLVARYMCPDMIQVHDRMTVALWREVEDDVSLNSFKRFVSNCKLRRLEEQRIREQLQLTDEDEVRIPPPGIANPNPRELEQFQDPFAMPDPLLFFNSGYQRTGETKTPETK
jgi:hypothetical protein